MSMFVPAGVGGGGAGGLTLGPPTNEFSGANRTAAQTARDTYATANASWLAQYDAEPTYTIILEWPAANPTNTIYQARRSGSWADVTGLLRGPQGEDGADAPPPIYQRWIFQAAATVPATPTEPSNVDPPAVPGIPSGWVDDPPAGTTPIWASLQTRGQDRTVVTYSDPRRWDGEDGSGGSSDEVVVKIFVSGNAYVEGELVSMPRGDVYIAQREITAGSANSRVNPNDATNDLWEPIQGYVGAWNRGGHYREGNFVEHSGRIYFALNKVSNSQTAPDSDTTNFQLVGNQNLTDAEIGDRAFKNPPSLNTTQQAAVRTAIGAGPGRTLDDLPIPEWVATSGYVAGELVRDPHDRVFMLIADLAQSNNAPATDATHFAPVSGFGGVYADSTAYPVGELVTHSSNVYFVATAVAATNTDDPSTNNSFIRINGGGSVEANPDGSATDSLLKIGIDGTVYSLPSGGGDGSSGGTTTLYEDSAYTTAREDDNWYSFTLSRAPADNSLLEIYTRQNNNFYGYEGVAGPNATVLSAKTWKELDAVVKGSEPASATAQTRTDDVYLFYTGSIWNNEYILCRYSDTEIGIRADTNQALGFVEIREITFGGGGSSGGTTVEANPSGAVDSGALTKLDVDGSIYSVGAGDGTVSTDATISGDGSSGDPLAVANPFTAADEAVLDAIVQDVIVFWLQSAQHAAFDAVGPGDTIDINYGTGNADTVQATVRGISRATNVAKIVIDPLTVWPAIVRGNTVIVEDAANNTIGSWQTAGIQTTRAGVTSFGDWWRQERAPGAGADVWEEMDRIDALDDTHLTLGTRTATTLEIASSTGNNVTVPSASTTQAGLESAADKTQLSASPPVWVTATAYDAGVQRVWQGLVYECILARTITDTDNPATDTTGWAPVTATGTTDLSIGTRTGTTMVLESSSGSNATLPAATTSDAGLETAADKVKTNALPDNWSAKIWTAGEQCTYSNVIYICLVDRTASNTDTPDNDTSSWAPVTGDQDLSGYVTTTALAAYSNTTAMNTAIATAIANLDALVDKGAWNTTDSFDEHDFVRHSGASYIALGAVNAGIEPGVTSGWATSWYRLAYSAGPPTALTTPALAGQVLSFPDIGGTTTEITLPTTGSADTAPATRSERVTFQAVASATADVEGIPISTDPVSVVFPDGAERSVITSLSGNDITLKAGVYLIDVHGTITGANNQARVTFDIRQSSDDAVLESSTSPHIGSTAGEVSAYAQIFLTEDTAINIFARRFLAASSIAANWTATFTRWGGSNSFDPATLGVDTFPLTGAQQTIALTDDTSGNAIVCPETGWLLVESMIPGLGLNNKVDWYSAARLRADKTAGAGLYTNSANEILLQVAAHEGGATTGNIVRVFYTGATTAGGITPPPPAKPQIRTFRVTGDKQVPAGSIQGDTYDFESQISQSSHVGSARIVGFIGTSQNPSSVAQLHVISDFSDETGTLTLPNVTLTANQIYTLRLEVYETGETFADTPTVYADYRITAVAASLRTHFGYLLSTQDETDIQASGVDISTAADAAGNWTVQLPGSTDYRMFWRVPSANTQPTTFTTAGFAFTSTLEIVRGVTINGASYDVYMTEADAPFDSSANGTILVVT